MNEGVISVQRSFYRCTAGSRQPLDTTGALLNCFRYNVIGCPALYFADSAVLALEEHLQIRDEFQILEFTPRSVWTVRVRLERVLDLTDDDVLRRVRVSRTSLTDAYSRDPGNPSITQIVAKQARRSGIQGILAPSAIVRSHTNLVVFRDNVEDPDALLVIEREEQIREG